MGNWLIEKGLNKFIPSALRGALVAITAYMIAHTELLAHFGVIYDVATKTIVVHLDKLDALIDTVTLAGIAGAVKVAQHNIAGLMGQPQTQPK